MFKGKMKKVLAVLTSLVLVLTLSFTSYASVIYGTTDNAYAFGNLPYGTHERQVYDLFIPKEHDYDIGVILYIHGGAYTSGDKTSYHDKLIERSDKGYCAASMNYRYMDNDVSLNDILDDIDDCLYAIRDFGEEHNISINRVLLRGYSAGGHLALLYAYSRKDTAPITPVAVVSDAGGPADCTDPYFYQNNILFDQEGAASHMSKACGKTFTFATRNTAKNELLAISPLTYVGKGTVPSLLNYGVQDPIIPYSHGENLAKKILDNGGFCHLVSYGNSGHDLGDDWKKELETEELFEDYCKYFVGF